MGKHRSDVVTVPTGYTASVLIRLGDPLAAGTPQYLNNGYDSAQSFATRCGDGHDGMQYFGMGWVGRWEPTSASRGLLVFNNEYVDQWRLHPNGPTISGSGVSATRPASDEVIKEFLAHGVTIVEAQQVGGVWSYRQDSALNRRVHATTETILSGPAAGTSYLVTRYSTTGTRTRGIVNNCACGHTPWGTYLTCEENWAGYFRRIESTDDPNRTSKERTALRRYGVTGFGSHLWGTVTPDTADNLYGRWNAMVLGTSAAQDYRNAANTFGWVVEIDPFSATSVPRKRTALGRFAHEGAWPARVVAGQPLVYYMGCDARNEYVYKYVSNQPWDPADIGRGAAAGDKYLDDGKLYVARFAADGSGQWIELRFGTGNVTASNPAYPFADQADVLVHARLAADAAGATRMDRPEWGAVDPITGAVYMTLTNNDGSSRRLSATDAANPRHYNDARTDGTAQWGNPNGHIIRWLETDANPAASTFRWDVFLFGARATADAVNVNISGLDHSNDFSSPDGLWFSELGVCWIETDDSAYSDVSNCMLLAALPGAVGDGGTRTIVNTDASGNRRSVSTHVGAAPGDRLRRFLVGPVGCEITGLTETPGGETLFVNIQHPTGHWPDGGGARARSATIAITRIGGGVVGL